MVHASIPTDDFARAASQAGQSARQAALVAGYPVVFVDATGRYVEEWPNGKRFEILLLTLVAGPNGSGKSTLTAAIAFEGLTSVVDPDAIASNVP